VYQSTLDLTDVVLSEYNTSTTDIPLRKVLPSVLDIFSNAGTIETVSTRYLRN
jgi:hypothetical protein